MTARIMVRAIMQATEAEMADTDSEGVGSEPRAPFGIQIYYLQPAVDEPYGLGRTKVGLAPDNAPAELSYTGIFLSEVATVDRASMTVKCDRYAHRRTFEVVDLTDESS